MGEMREDQKAKLTFKTSDNTEKEVSCFVKEIFKDRISLTIPKDARSYSQYLQEGQEVPVQVFTPTGINAFESIIINSPLESEFIIEYIGEYVQIQRREYARSTLETKVIIEREKSPNVVTKTIDIGGGGVRFFYDGKFEEKEKVRIRLYLPLQLSSIVAQGYIIDQPHLPKTEHVVYFTSIQLADREKIIKKCHEIGVNPNT